MKTPEKSKPRANALADKLMAEAERAFERARSEVNNHELDYYLDGTNIRTKRVDESDDITPEQVAILGAFSYAAQLLENLKLIREGKEIKKATPKKKKSKSDGHSMGLISLTGKGDNIKIIQTGDEIPPEIMKALKKFIKEHDNDE